MMAAFGRGAEQMRVTALHLVADAAQHVRKVERSQFLGHARVEHDLKREIAELIGERVHVIARDGVGDFIGFLDRIGRDRREILDPVPFAAAHRIAQPSHDGHQPTERVARVRRAILFERLVHGGGPSSFGSIPPICEYDNMHYVKLRRHQDCKTSHLPSTLQRDSVERKFMPSTFILSSSAMCSPTF